MTVPVITRFALAALLLATLCARAQDKPGLLLLQRAKSAKPAASKPVPPPAATNSPALSVKDIAARVKPSLVTITFTGRDGSVDGTGSGFVVAPDGLIATSLHVIGEARPIKVQFADGQKFDVTEVHAWDRRSDLALIRIDAKGLTPLPLGDSDTLEQGSPIVAMGNPRGLDFSVVSGVVSARREVKTGDLDADAMIQLAIPIEPGNSGGPLLDMAGRVHGILTLKSALTENLGFAMPINSLKPLLAKPNPTPIARWLTIGNLNPREWQPLLGARWSQKAGRISVEGTGKGFGGRALCLNQREVPAVPYEIAVTVKLDSESGAAGLIFSADGGDLHYGFYPTAGQLRLTRFDGPTVYSWAILKTVPSPHYRAGDWNTIKVRVEKDRLLCYVNDQLAIESDDATLRTGKVGLAKFRDTKAAFKNFQVAKTIPSAATTAGLEQDLIKQLEALTTPPSDKLLLSLQTNAAASRAVLTARADRLEKEVSQLRTLARTVHRRDIQAALLRELDQPETKIDLFHAALLLAKLDNEELDLAAYRRQLDDMARDITAQLAAMPDEETKLKALKKFLFEENGFHGSRADYNNRANSYINEVLDDREGIPITLSVVFLELARRIGLDTVSGAPVPGHFMVLHRPKMGNRQLLDIFDGGVTVPPKREEELRLTDEDLQPATKRSIIVRMLRNLISGARATQDAAAMLRYQELIVALAPESPGDRIGRALLRLQNDDPEGGRLDLLWLLENRPRGVDLERIEQLLRSLR
ncbi:MAG: peptidase S1 and S6 chymotrypsin/Hap [Limisphaerales bacterium]|nr:MAG: peptidase S1 and S6 chymotrypsin/Hap [Limisphaerales bacterium]KAG0510686.1 MAG: peptidase S1 and S6 chymotrypsin/Hap [Limisphaerales bacterium]TXT52582.1 MAG: peptidase S1 and S6 chymotrypsin/Hap [Limisphaerales bacterium]